MAGFEIEPYKTAHFWSATAIETGILIQVLRRQCLHACVPVVNVITLPALVQEKGFDVGAMANVICREIDRQLAEEPAQQ